MQTTEESVPASVLAMAELIHQKIGFNANQELIMNGSLYDEFLPSNLNPDILATIDGFNQNVVGAYMVAFGDILAHALTMEPGKVKNQIEIPLTPFMNVVVEVTYAGEDKYTITGRLVSAQSVLETKMEKNPIPFDAEAGQDQPKKDDNEISQS